MRPDRTLLRWCAVVTLTLGISSAVQADDPVPASLAVYPADVNLLTARGRQTFVVQASYADGITRDVTALAKATLTDPTLAKLDKNVLTPLADGATELKVEFGGQALNIPVKVKDAKADRPVSFKRDVMPIFMRAGCNQGSCHGAARGKDGFRLSLFGFDADGDHYRLTREFNGRRINLAIPAEGLLMEKAAGKCRTPAANASRKATSTGRPSSAGTRPGCRPISRTSRRPWPSRSIRSQRAPPFHHQYLDRDG